MELTSTNSSTREQIEFFLNLFEDYHKINDVNDKTINIYVFYHIFKHLIGMDHYKKYNYYLKESIKNELINDINLNEENENVYIDKEKFANFLINNYYVQKILIKFKRRFKNSSKIYEEELMNIFLSNMGNIKSILNQKDITELYKNDYYHFEKILNAMEEKRIINQELQDEFNDEEEN